MPVKSFTVTWHHSNTHTMQGHHSAKPHTSCQVPCCHVHACCSRSCELDAQALSAHRSRVLVWRQFSLPAYTRVTNFCHIFGPAMGVGLYASIYGNWVSCELCVIVRDIASILCCTSLRLCLCVCSSCSDHTCVSESVYVSRHLNCLYSHCTWFLLLLEASCFRCAENVNSAVNISCIIVIF